jgi:branched-chain amino acid aminotransferase
MIIRPIQKSRIESIDFDNLSFGTIFTDHMFVCDYVDGAWGEPEIIPYASIQLDPSASALHYGQAIFEGMKAYKDDNDDVWLFRPDQNIKRLNKSAERLAIPQFPEDLFLEGLHKLIDLDRDWVQSGFGNSLYIRPFMFASEACVQASPAKEYRIMIICAPVSSYYNGGEVRVKIADHFSRAAQGGTGYAKAAGNYAGQFYPTQLAIDEGYQQIIWTDAASHQYIEEAGTMNLFFNIGDKLITAPTSDSILDGVTRKSVIALAKERGIEVETRQLSVSELIEAAKNNTLKEIFGSGTAVVVLPIHGFGYKGEDFQLPKSEDSLALKLKSDLTSIQYNKSDDPYGWRVKV